MLRKITPVLQKCRRTPPLDFQPRHALLSTVCDREEYVPKQKVTIIGAGQVGMACVAALLNQRITSEVALVDNNQDLARGEMMDWQHGILFLNDAKITAGSDYAISANSSVTIMTAGVRQKKGETRLELVSRNAEIMQKIIPEVVKYSPDTVIVMITNPVDVMTYVAWKASGLSKNKVIGTGTSLDSARFRYFLAQRLGVATSSCHGWIIGEHGDTSVAVWSGVNVAGVRLQEMCPRAGEKDDPNKWYEVHEKVIKAAYDIIKAKGYTNWAIGLCAAFISKAILADSSKVYAVSILGEGYHGINEEVFLSLPVVLGAGGTKNVIRQHLASSELAALRHSADVLLKTQSQVKISTC